MKHAIAALSALLVLSISPLASAAAPSRQVLELRFERDPRALTYEVRWNAQVCEAPCALRVWPGETLRFSSPATGLSFTESTQLLLNGATYEAEFASPGLRKFGVFSTVMGSLLIPAGIGVLAWWGSDDQVCDSKGLCVGKSEPKLITGLALGGAGVVLLTVGIVVLAKNQNELVQRSGVPPTSAPKQTSSMAAPPKRADAGDVLDSFEWAIAPTRHGLSAAAGIRF